MTSSSFALIPSLGLALKLWVLGLKYEFGGLDERFEGHGLGLGLWVAVEGLGLGLRFGI